jgi:hypothetical protein
MCVLVVCAAPAASKLSVTRASPHQRTRDGHPASATVSGVACEATELECSTDLMQAQQQGVWWLMALLTLSQHLPVQSGANSYLNKWRCKQTTT